MINGNKYYCETILLERLCFANNPFNSLVMRDFLEALTRYSTSDQRPAQSSLTV